tara:strand:- start:856 stop:1419 length:564 start_codon:yes stop_codon:yes gene_type:complete
MSTKKIDPAIWKGDPIWPAFVEVEAHSQYPASQKARTFLNERYEVTALSLEGGVTWLTIKRRKKETVHDWRELQEIKNQICGRDREAMELYPGNWRAVDTSNQYHLWVLPEYFAFNVGFLERDVSEDVPDEYEFGTGRQRPLPGWMEPGVNAMGAGTMVCRPVDEEGNLQMVVNVGPLDAPDEEGDD